jgi:hypothetical protein
MLRLAVIFCLSVTVFTGCSSFPQLDGAISPATQNAAYPTLIPIGQIITGAKNPQIHDQSVAALTSRVTNLNARANRLRAPVLDATTRGRLRAAIKRHQ